VYLPVTLDERCSCREETILVTAQETWFEKSEGVFIGVTISMHFFPAGSLSTDVLYGATMGFLARILAKQSLIDVRKKQTIKDHENSEFKTVNPSTTTTVRHHTSKRTVSTPQVPEGLPTTVQNSLLSLSVRGSGS
jgi:hypothetical protein